MIDLSTYSTICITGATGWLGRRIVAALTTGIEGVEVANKDKLKIRCLVQPGELTKNLLDLGIEVSVGSVTDKVSLVPFLRHAERGLLIHTAGLIHPRLFISDFKSVNVQGTRNLIEVAQREKFARSVVMSSNSPFGANKTNTDVFTEESAYNPYRGYGKSKRLMETDLKRRIRKDEAAITIVRAPWFYGPGQPPRQTLFFQMIKEGKFPILGNGNNRRSMGYVDSLALGMLLAASNEKAKGQIYWLADERPYPMEEIIGTVRSVLSEDFSIACKPTTVHVPRQIGDIARIADAVLQGVGLYQQKIHVLSEMDMTIACSIEKAKKDIGFTPIVELREGMRRSIKWCLDNGQTI